MSHRYLNMYFQNRQTLGLVKSYIFVYFSKEKNYLLSHIYIWNMFPSTIFFILQLKKTLLPSISPPSPPYPQANTSKAIFFIPIAENLNS